MVSSSTPTSLERYPDQCRPRPLEWDDRWWSPITNAEHLHLRDHVGMVDLTAFNEFDIEGPGAVEYLQHMTVNSVDVAVGRSVYTPLLDRRRRVPLRPHDACVSPTTTVRVVTGAFDGGRDRYWFTRNLPADGSVTFTDRTSGMCTVGVWGPKAPATMAKIVTGQHEPYDVTQDGFPYGAVRDVLIDGVPCTMFRISYVGDNGWEVYTNVEHGLRVWDSIWEAGQEFDIRPVGIGVYAVTGRIEKGYRLMGAELESEYNPVEAGLARPKVKSADFIGKAAYLEARDARSGGTPVHATR